MSLSTALFATAAFFSILIGGLVSFRMKDRLHFVMAFAAGVLLGITAFEILPEIFHLAEEHGFEPLHAMMALAGSFLAFHFLEKSVLIHHGHEGDYAHHHHPHVGALSSAALIGHSFLDGMGIGIGFQVSLAVGFAIAIAVVAHGFTDGMNTVTFMLSHKNTKKRTRVFLLANAIAPIGGALLTLFFEFPPYLLFLYLGGFAGFLFYIGAGDILPEAHSRESSYRMIGLTVLGTAFAFAITQIGGHV